MGYRSSDPTLTDEDAEAIAAEMARLDPGGEGLTAREYHLSQKPLDAPRHHRFEWDDTLAGVLWRDVQARKELRCPIFVTPSPSGGNREMRALLAVSPSKKEGGSGAKVYRPALMVMAEEVGANQILNDAKRQLRGWRDRWRTYADVFMHLSQAFDVIDRLLGDETPGDGMENEED